LGWDWVDPEKILGFWVGFGKGVKKVGLGLERMVNPIKPNILNWRLFTRSFTPRGHLCACVLLTAYRWRYQSADAIVLHFLVIS